MRKYRVFYPLILGLGIIVFALIVINAISFLKYGEFLGPTNWEDIAYSLKSGLFVSALSGWALYVLDGK